MRGGYTSMSLQRTCDPNDSIVKMGLARNSHDKWILFTQFLVLTCVWGVSRATGNTVAITLAVICIAIVIRVIDRTVGLVSGGNYKRYDSFILVSAERILPK